MSGIADPMLRLAAMQVESDQHEYRQQREELGAARAARREANERAADEIDEQAGAVMRGALVSGALTIGGGLLQAGAAYVHSNAQKSVAEKAAEAGAKAEVPEPLAARLMRAGGEAATHLSQPANAIVGEAPSLAHQAAAQRARGQGEEASWRADDAQARAQRAEKSEEQTLDALRATLQAKRDATSAILSRM